MDAVVSFHNERLKVRANVMHEAHRSVTDVTSRHLTDVLLSRCRVLRCGVTRQSAELTNVAPYGHGDISFMPHLTNSDPRRATKGAIAQRDQGLVSRHCTE